MSVYLVSRSYRGVHHRTPTPRPHCRRGPNTRLPFGHGHARPQRKRHRHYHRSLDARECFQCVWGGAAEITGTHYQTRHQQDHRGATLHTYDPEHTSLEGRKEGMAFSCWFENRRVHDGQHPLRQRSRPRRKMLWPQGRARMQIQNWRRRRFHRSLCRVPQFKSKGVQRKRVTDQTKR